MNKWSPERAEAIRQFIDEYFMENRKSPTVRDTVGFVFYIFYSFINDLKYISDAF